jgi:hypothetical protein
VSEGAQNPCALVPAGVVPAGDSEIFRGRASGVGSTQLGGSHVGHADGVAGTATFMQKGRAPWAVAGQVVRF